MKKIRFLFMIIYILALSINLCYASDYDNELYGEVNQTEFEFAVLNGGNYSIAIETENNINSISLDSAACEYTANATGYTLDAELAEGIHNLSFDTEDEVFCVGLIKISEVEKNKAYFIYSDEYSSYDFASDRVADTIEADGESVKVRNFEDSTNDSNGRSVSFTFTVEEDGLYSIVSYIGRDDNRWTSANSSYIDGVMLELKSTSNEDIVGDTTYITKKIFSDVKLSAGEHTMRIDALQRNNADYSLKYCMTKLEYLGGEVTSENSGLMEIKIQAEHYTSVSQEILNDDQKVINPIESRDKADGGAVIRVNTKQVPQNDGYSFTYKVNVPKSGLYNFYIHGGKQTSQYISPIEYSIDGEDFVSVKENFTVYKDSEIDANLIGHHYHINGVYLEEGERVLTIRCSQARSSDSATYYIFLDSMTFVETGIAVSDIENAEYGETLKIEIDASLPGRERGDVTGEAVKYSTASDAVSISEGEIIVNGGEMATVKAELADYETLFNVNTTINKIGVYESKLMSDGNFGAAIKNYGEEEKSFCCVRIQREGNGKVKSIGFKNYTLSAGGTVVVAIENQEGYSAEMFLISSQDNYAPVSDYLND